MNNYQRTLFVLAFYGLAAYIGFLLGDFMAWAVK